MDPRNPVKIPVWQNGVATEIVLRGRDLTQVARHLLARTPAHDLAWLAQMLAGERIRREAVDARALEGLLESKRRKALRRAKHEANARAAQVRREARKAAWIARRRAEASEMAERRHLAADRIALRQAPRPAVLDPSASAYAHAFGI